MREIKFRQVFVKDDGKFSHFEYWGRIDHNRNPTESGFTSPSSNSFSSHKEDQQYTGLLDKNGIEIYEGDIIQHRAPEYRYTVRWGKYGWDAVTEWNGFHRPINELVFTEIEVVGNIFQSTELIQQ